MPTSGIEFRPFVPAARPPSGTALDMSPEQMAQILWLIEKIGRTVDLDQVLDLIFDNVRPLIPFNRIGLAFLQEPGQQVASRWVRSDRPVLLGKDFVGDLRSSSLQTVLERRQVRIINDLAGYVAEHPASESTRLLVQEGMRASLTCPLIVRDRAVGFLFFTSIRPGAYNDAALHFYQSVAAQLSLVIEKARLYTELSAYAHTVRKHNEEMDHQLELARKLQRMLVPASPPPVAGLDMALHYQPVIQVGGDLVELTPLPDGSLLVFVADAMGHGVQAALVMSMLKGMLASMVRTDVAVGALMRQLNAALRPLLQEYFAVAICLHLDLPHSRLRMARAGIPPALLWRCRESGIIELDSGGMPLAVADEPFPLEEHSFERGDMLLIATDGLMESANAADQQFGQQRVLQTFGRCAGRSAQECVALVLQEQQSFCAGREPSDDMTLLAIRRVE